MSETKTKYLYGAAVQGIQGFIFQTNKLKEIVGASELVEQVCTTAFGKLLGKDINDLDMIIKDENWIVGAAGNIKYIFESEETCQKIVREFPRSITEMAPGITISQAVVKLNGDYAEKSQMLESKLRAQRNRITRPMNLGLMAIKRAPSTGFPGVKYDTKKNGGEELIDEATKLKREASETQFKLAEKAFEKEIRESDIAFDIEDLTDKNNWIAIIHADGNGLGQIVQQIGKSAKELSLFSPKLDEITKSSARFAYEWVRNSFFKEQYQGATKIPIRPIILSGDDFTMICRADIAIEYTKQFLETFEESSKKELSKLDVNEKSKQILQNGLTACAGIAFVKASYPFHYAVTLAESLCKRAKDKSKNLVKGTDNKLAPSCLMFYKVQDSFVENFSEIARRTLTPHPKISLEYGPYYCGKRAEEVARQDAICENTIDRLMTQVEDLKKEEGKPIRSNLRNWLTLLFENTGKANQRMQRICDIGNQEIVRSLNLQKYSNLKSMSSSEINTDSSKVAYIPFYDMLSIVSLDIETKKNKEEKK